MLILSVFRIPLAEISMVEVSRLHIFHNIFFESRQQFAYSPTMHHLDVLSINPVGRSLRHPPRTPAIAGQDARHQHEMADQLDDAEHQVSVFKFAPTHHHMRTAHQPALPASYAGPRLYPVHARARCSERACADAIPRGPRNRPILLTSRE